MLDSKVNNQTKSHLAFWDNRSQMQRNIIKATPVVAAGLAALAFFVVTQTNFLNRMKEDFLNISQIGMQKIILGGGEHSTSNVDYNNSTYPCLPGYTTHEIVVADKEDVTQKAIDLFNNVTSNGRDITSFYGYYAHAEGVESTSDDFTQHLKNYDAGKLPERKATFRICRQTFRSYAQQVISNVQATVRAATKGLWE